MGGDAVHDREGASLVEVVGGRFGPNSEGQHSAATGWPVLAGQRGRDEAEGRQGKGGASGNM
jgi:hypothetical protein